MEIGNKILELRKKNNLSQEDLAEKIGVARQTISKWELGETSPDLKQSKALSQIFNVSLDELVDNDIKDVLVEKVSNTEKLAGVILTILKVMGIFIIVLIVIFIIRIILFIPKSKLSDSELKVVSITCTLHNNEYGYEFRFDEETGNIYYTSGDGYLADITDVEQYSDAYKALNKIDAYVRNNGGSCSRSDDYSE